MDAVDHLSDKVILGTFGGKFINQIPAASLPFVKARLPNSVIPNKEAPNPSVSNDGLLPINAIAQDSNISHVTEDIVDQNVDVKAETFNSPNMIGKMTGSNVITPSVAISLRGSQQPQIGMISNRAKAGELNIWRYDSELPNASSALDNGIGAVTQAIATPSDVAVRVNAQYVTSGDNPNLHAASTPTPKAATPYSHYVLLIVLALLVWKFLI